MVGFDNQEIIAAQLYPALTTMQLPHYQMGHWAIDELLRLIAQGGPTAEPPVQHKMPCRSNGIQYERLAGEERRSDGEKEGVLGTGQ